MSEPTVVETLRKARALLAEGKWCKWAPARDDEGSACDAASPRAVAWCAVGAIRKVDPYFRTVTAADNYLERVAPGNWPVTGKAHTFNDQPNTTLEDVLALYDRAIEMAERDSA